MKKSSDVDICVGGLFMYKGAEGEGDIMVQAVHSEHAGT